VNRASRRVLSLKDFNGVRASSKLGGSWRKKNQWEACKENSLGARRRAADGPGEYTEKAKKRV